MSWNGWVLTHMTHVPAHHACQETQAPCRLDGIHLNLWVKLLQLPEIQCLTDKGFEYQHHQLTDHGMEKTVLELSVRRRFGSLRFHSALVDNPIKSSRYSLPQKWQNKVIMMVEAPTKHLHFLLKLVSCCFFVHLLTRSVPCLPKLETYEADVNLTMQFLGASLAFDPQMTWNLKSQARTSSSSSNSLQACEGGIIGSNTCC